MSEFEHIPPGSINVLRDERQRRAIDPGNLVDSVRRLGVLNPIIVKREGTILVAGERRLRAALDAGLETVPVRYFEDLSYIDAQIIELEENLKRSDLPWQDEVKAIARLHKLYLEAAPNWNQEKTANALGVSPSEISKTMRVVEDLALPQVASAASLNAAFNVLSRRDDRAFNDVMSSIDDATAGAVGSEEDGASSGIVDGSGISGNNHLPSESNQPGISSLSPSPRPEEAHIIHANFQEWIATYNGPKFNFVHCDFPYGIGVFNGAQSGRDTHVTYDDSAETYWSLIECFCQNLDKFMAAQAHLMFWLSGDIEIQSATIRRFAALAPSLAFQTFPLYWIKSDNVGILPDLKRGPRRIVETALIAAREDRLIVKAVSNAYSSPTDKAHHPSTKPEPMLRQFFQMFVDESTTLFDPTCGSGAALRAAESLGARRVLGLEIDEEHCASARSALRAFRSRQSLARAI